MSTLAEALAPRSDQLNADDLIPGPRVIKFTKARILKDGRDTKIVLNFEGDNGKPWKPCKTMGRAMVMAWAITDESQLVGKSVRVFRDPDVTFGDQGAIGGIRISHMSDIAKPANVKLTVSQGKKKLFTFHPLVTDTQQQAHQNNGPDQVTQWVRDLIARINAAPDRAAVDAILSEPMVAKRRPRLKAERAELSADLEAAITNFADDPFAEGRSDDQHGEAFNGNDDTTQQEDN